MKAALPVKKQTKPTSGSLTSTAVTGSTQSSIPSSLLEYVLTNDLVKLTQIYADAQDPSHAHIAQLVTIRGAEDGRTAIDWAAILGYSDLLTFLLEKGSNPNSVNDKGYSALHLACAWGNLKCVETLLSHNADYTLRTSNDETPADIAIRYNRNFCLMPLKRAEARLELQNAVSAAKELILSQSKIFTADVKTKMNTTIKGFEDWLESNKESYAYEFSNKKCELDIVVAGIIASKLPPTPTGNGKKGVSKEKSATANKTEAS